MATRLSSPIHVGRYEIRGTDDWFVFARNILTRKWVYWYTECDKHWSKIALQAGLGDDPPENVIAVGVMMALADEPPTDVASADAVAELEQEFC